MSLVLWATFKPSRLKMVPGPLVAVVVATIAAAALALQIKYVTAPANLAASISFPTPEALMGVFANQEMLLAALALAFIASAETLLCASAVDQMHSGPRANYDRELFAQGVGNLLCGAVGALPMTGVIVRSSANIEAGGQTRWSAIMHGVWLLALVVAATRSAAHDSHRRVLRGILVYTGYKLVNPAKIRMLAKFGWSEVGIYFATMIGIVVTDLLTGVITGFALAIAKLVYRSTHLRINMVHSGAATTFNSRARPLSSGCPSWRRRWSRYRRARKPTSTSNTCTISTTPAST